MNTEVEFRYNTIFFPSLEEQANKQGFTLGKKAEELENDRKSLFDVQFTRLFTDSQIDKAYEKLNKRVIKQLKPLKKEKE